MEETRQNLKRTGFSLRFKLTVGLILIIGILFAGLNTYNVLQTRQKRRREALNNNKAITLLIAGALLGELGDNEIHSERIRTFLRNFLNSTFTLNKDNKELAFALVVDDKSQLVVGRAKPELTAFKGGTTLPKEDQVLETLARGTELSASMSMTQFHLKVGGGKEVGRLLVGTSLARVEAEARADLIFNAVVFLGALVLLFLYASIALSYLVVSPINKVVKAMGSATQGNLMSEVDLKRGDEIGILANSYNFMVRGLRERERLKDAFNRYVSRQVYEKFQSGEIRISGENRQATVLFSDIRSFTTLSEQLTPPEVVAMLNEYFNVMVEIIFKYDGFLNKFIGDALMAIYNVPLDQFKPELRATMTAIEMMQDLDKLNADREKRGQFPIKIGIGINTGPVVAGNIGHEKRLEYTVIGDAVNLAQRLESQTKVAGATILLSETTYSAVSEYVEATTLPPVKVKGKAEPVALYAVTGLKPGVKLPQLLTAKDSAAATQAQTASAS